MSRLGAPTNWRTSSAWAACGAAGLAASFVSTAFVGSALVPLCACAGFAVFVLGCRRSLRIARVDDFVFEQQAKWSAPDLPTPVRPIRRPDRARKGLAAV